MTFLSEGIIKTLQTNHQSIATAESCTGGLLAYQFTAIAGASEVFLGGIVSYTDKIKHQCLGVPKELLECYGAVSEPVVRAMLEGVFRVFGVTYAMATSGVAGPSGGSAQNPVGTVYIGVQRYGLEPIVERHLLTGERKEIQHQSCQIALERLAKISKFC
ncbi:hypothetical protein BKH46_07040 [Helicobacter sp. 12S02634-8]|nr:hypothetical protein BKH46_07040 [Helicobacter sp. 12S02634-8]